MKRFWMLLLAVMALTIVLATPAMAADEGTLSYCLCGDVDGHEGTTVNGCDGTVLEWQPWTTTGSLPNSGCWYLTESFSVTGQTQVGSTTQNVALYIDLHGCTVTDQNNRMIAINTGNATYNIDVWITDTVGNGALRMDYSENSAMQNNAYGGAYKGEGAIIWSNKANATVNLIKGTLDASRITVTQKGGGAVCVTTGVFNVYGGTILGGSSDTYGGAVAVLANGTLNLYGGQISGGSRVEKITNNDGIVYNKIADDNIYVAGAMNIHGGTIGGYVDASNASGVTVSGAPTITGGATNLNIGENVLTVGEMTGGNIGITASVEGVFGAPADGVTLTSAYAGYFSADSRDKGVAYAEISTTALATYGGFLWFGHYDCLCAKAGTDAQGNAVCVGGDACDGEENLVWIPWDTDILNTYSTHYAGGVVTVPLSSGNWYLTDNITVTRNSPIRASAVVNLDLNGKTVTAGGTGTYRVFQMNNSANAIITVTDGDDGDAETVGAIVNSKTYTQGGIVWLASSSCSFTLIAGTLDASGYVCHYASGGMAVSVNSTSTFTMYGGTLKGGTDRSTDDITVNGGTVNSAGTVAIHGGTIEGAAVSGNGGAIQSTKSLTITGGTITGGTAAEGGNIYATGTVTISGGTIDGYVDVSAATTINISGAPVILAVDANGEAVEGAANLSIGANNLTVGTMTGGNIGITTTDAASAPVFGVASEALGTIPYAYKAYFSSDDTAYQVIKAEEGLSLAAASADHIHCVCGGAIGDGTKLSDGTTVHYCCDVVYTALSDASAMASGGAFYLSGPMTGSVTVTGALDLCLNGKTWTGDGAQRPLYIDGTTATISDCGGTGIIEGHDYETNTNALGGAVYVAGGNLNLYGGTVTGGSAMSGGNVYANGSSTVKIYGGTVSYGSAFSYTDSNEKTTTGQGANIYITGTSGLTLYGGTVSYGTSTGNGGNIRIANGSCTMTMYGGTVTKGVSSDQGGNLFTSGNIDLLGGTVSDGVAKNGGNICVNANGKIITLAGVQVLNGTTGTVDANGKTTVNTGAGGNIRLNTNACTLNVGAGTVISGGVSNNTKGSIKNICVSVTGCTLNFYGGQIYGYVGFGNDSYEAEITLSGAPVIAGGTSNLSLGTNTVTVGADLSKDANVVIACSDAANSRQVAIEVPENADTSGITYQDGEYVVVRDGTTLYLAQPGAILNGNTDKVYALPGAIAAAVEANDYVTLTADHTGDLTVTGDLFLDLNGFTITGNVTVTGGTLKLFDSATADYCVNEDANGKTYGRIVGTITGNVARTCNTPKATYGSNYRYLVIKDGEGYHAHRFYMTVKSTVLYPTKAALNYRTVLRCDEVVAGYINAEGGAYGVKVTADQTAYSDYTESGIQVGAYGVNGDENNLVTQLGSIIDTVMEPEAQKYNAEYKVKTSAYILIPDQFYTDENTATTSATVTKSLKDMVQAADAMTDLNATQKALLGVFYSRYPSLFGAESNNAWQLSNIPLYAENLNLKYYCLCGDSASTNNPCAENGHKALAWQAWNKTDSLPTEGGNWYLTGNVTLTEAVSLTASQFVCIDTQGYNITSAGRVAVVGNGAILNLVNGNTEDRAAVVSGVGEGSALLIEAGGNVSLYAGVTLTGTSTTGNGGVVTANGDLNIYGGTVTAGAAAEGATLNGGAIYVGTDGYLFINQGTVTGTAAAKGGAIYSEGRVELDGTAAVSGGTAAQGGNIYAAGKLYVTEEATVSGGVTTEGGFGGNIYAAGEVYLSGGTVSGGIATVKVTEKTDSSGKITYTYSNGRGGNFYVSGTLEIADGTVTGGSAGNEGGNVYLTGEMTVSGGTVSGGKAGSVHTNSAGASVTRNGWGGNIEVTGSGELTVEAGATISGGETKGNGGSIRVGGSAKLTMTGGEITGGKTNDQGGNLFSSGTVELSGGTITEGDAKNGGNIAMNGGEMILNGVTVSDGVATAGGGNIRINSTSKTKCDLILEGGKVTGGSAETGGNIHAALNKTTEGYVASVSISGCTVEKGTADTNGGNIYTSVSLEVSGGTVSEGTAAANGGNIYATGAVTVSGGEVKDGKVENETAATGCGGNIYATAALEISGDARISGGKVFDGLNHTEEAYKAYKSYGGNIYATGDVTVSESAVITGGRLGGYYRQAWGGNICIRSGGCLTMSGGTVSEGYTVYNTGNVHIDTGADFTMSGGDILDGWAVNAAGNLYVGNTTASISGGEISGGKLGADGKDTDNEFANVYVVSGALELSGGYINGGVHINAYADDAGLTLSGAPVVDGNGILLTYNSYKVDSTVVDEQTGEETTVTETKYYDVNVNLDLETFDSEKASVVLRTSKFNGQYAEGIALAAGTDNWASYEAVARRALVDYGTASEVTYEADGIYLRPGTDFGTKWSCSCGANWGDTHMDGCDRYDVQWNEWTSENLPTKEGYWYLSRSETKTDASGQAYATVQQTSIPYDYATVNATGDRIRVRTILAQNTSGSTMTDDDGKYVTVAEYYANNKALSYADEVGATLYTEDSYAYEDVDGNLYKLSELTLDTDGYEIHVDLNGYALESEVKARVYNLNVNTGAARSKTIEDVTYTYVADRTTPLTITVVDSSEGHTGSISAYGVHTEGYRLSGTQYQGAMIWMPRYCDTMNLSFVELDASSVCMGSGLAIYTGGNMNLHHTDIIGGVSQGSIMESNDTLTSAATGGGALYIYNGAAVTMTGGSIKNGTAIYRYMSGMTDTEGLEGTPAYYDRSVGGGNVYINDGTFTVNGGEISGGKALIYTGETGNPVRYYSYGSGGGIYVASGELIVKGSARIYDNFTGTVSGSLLANDEQNPYNFYNAVDMENATVSATTQDNIYLGGEIMTLEKLGENARVGFNVNTLDGSSYEGTFAYADANYITSGKLVCDDGAVNAANCSYADGKLYVAKGDTDTYLVGYGIANIQPELKDLQAGVIMTNYGNERDTSQLYTVDGYYDITTDSSNYFGGWDTQLYVTALATTDGEGDTVIIISADSSTFDDAIANHAKRMVSKATGVPMDNITISCEHQHSAPNAGIKYYEDGSVKTDYAATFYTGVVQAAVAAMNDRQQATVSVGTLDTIAEGDQYNFVRNVKLTFSNGTVGMLTDNHRTHYFASDYSIWVKPGAPSSLKVEAVLGGYTLSGVTLDYESEVDTTMQLVQYTQADGSVIVMTNFQTHPHVGSGGSSNYVHSDVIGAFRHYLEKNLESGTDTDYKVMYFSGAGGNVNTTTYLNGTYSDQDDSGKYPYADASLTSDTDVLGADSLKRLQKADIWGQSLASMTANFLGGKDYTADGTNKTVAMSAVTNGSKDVEVNVQTVTCTRKVTDASDAAIAKIAGEGGLLNWSDGSYQTAFINVGGSYETWYQYVGYSTAEEDQVYSAFDARRIRNSLLWAEAGKTELDMTVTAYAMGEIGFVAAPYEMFQENGQEIKTGASGSYAMTIVATLANGGNGYIPSAAGYANGGYSTDNSSFAEGTGEDMAKTFVDMLKGLKAE